LLMAMVQFVIRFPKSMSHLEESVTGHVGVKGVY
jgi:hypothetical protein